MQEQDRTVKELKVMLSQMPEEAMNALYWLLNNIELLDIILDTEEISEIEMQKCIKHAREKKDYLMLVIALFMKVKKEREAAGKRQENW